MFVVLELVLLVVLALIGYCNSDNYYIDNSLLVLLAELKHNSISVAAAVVVVVEMLVVVVVACKH